MIQLPSLSLNYFQLHTLQLDHRDNVRVLWAFSVKKKTRTVKKASPSTTSSLSCTLLLTPIRKFLKNWTALVADAILKTINLAWHCGIVGLWEGGGRGQERDVRESEEAQQLRSITLSLRVFSTTTSSPNTFVIERVTKIYSSKDSIAFNFHSNFLVLITHDALNITNKQT